MDYDPYKHRENANLTYFDALMNVIKVIFGTGILAMPISFQKTGWVTGIITTLVVVFVMTYTVHILIRCMVETCRRNQVPYLPLEEAIAMGFLEGPPWLHPFRHIFHFIVKFFMLAFYVGIGTAYIVFIAEGVNKFLETYFQPMNIRVLVLVMILPLTLIFLIRNLKSMVPFSTGANIMALVAYASIIVYVVQGLPPVSERRQFNGIEGIPFCIGTILFASNSLGVFLALESKMLEPWKFISFFGILNVAMLLNTVILIIFAFLGYLKYGDDVKGNITLNIADQGIYSQVVNGLLVLSIYFTYAVQCSVVIEILWTHGIASKIAEESQFFYEIILRILIVISTALFGIIVPKFDVILSIVGNAVVTVISVCLPAIFDMCLRYKTGYGFLGFYFFQDIFLFVIGLVCFVKGF